MSTIIEFNFEHKTPSSNNILINLHGIICETSILHKFENKELFNNMCKGGCPNYKKKWSCPPYSPKFSSYSENYKYALIVLMSCDLEQFNYIKTEYMKVKASHSILKSRMDNLMRSLENDFDGLMISSGSCKLCKPCNCKQSLTCKKPNLKRYSMEALGLDVGTVSLDLFKHELLWYKNKKAPSYSSILSCLLLNNLNHIDSNIIQYLK